MTTRLSFSGRLAFFCYYLSLFPGAMQIKKPVSHWRHGASEKRIQTNICETERDLCMVSVPIEPRLGVTKGRRHRPGKTAGKDVTFPAYLIPAPPEAKFLYVIGTKVLRVFLLAIHSHLY